METTGKENNDNLTQRVKLLKQALDLFDKEELELIRDKDERHYHFYPFPNDTQKFENFNTKLPIQLSKYVIEGRGKFDSVDCLKKGSALFIELESLIEKKLGKDYIIIFCKNINHYNNAQELFGVKFYAMFNKGLCGRINFDETRISDRISNLSLTTNNALVNDVEISVDVVYNKVMTYQGYDILDKNILFYGFDVEENRYLNHFFRHRTPRSIVNIIPYVSNSFLHDNVD